MTVPIESYALIGDCYTGALVGLDGSIDWLCMPRWDSPSLFGRLLGDEDNGSWSVAPKGAAIVKRAYDGDSLILITTWTSDEGEVEVIDFMPRGGHKAEILRRMRGIRGTMIMLQELRIRFDYARTIPWMRQTGTLAAPELLAASGPDAVVVRGAKLEPSDHVHKSELAIEAGEIGDLSLTWFPSHRPTPEPTQVVGALADTRKWWADWVAQSTPNHSPWSAAVTRSLVFLRALTHAETGGIIAAATTSLPESFGGSRNWDYRHVWLRDAALAIHVLTTHGYLDSSRQWREWMLRAIAGDPEDLRIMYGIGGERDLDERELPNLPGYERSSPVRIGNGASTQFQGDVVGEVMVAMRHAREAGVPANEFSWSLQRALIDYTKEHWHDQDSGIWEIRGTERYFTHSRAMIWAALDSAIHGVEDDGLDGPVEHWRQLRDTIRDEIEVMGFDAAIESYTQSYGSPLVDAALLQLPQIGYCAWDDPRMLGTVRRIESELLDDSGLLLRYRTDSHVDGLDGKEYPFLACSFWLVEQYARSGRRDDGVAMMNRLLALSNDVGMLSEEYDSEAKRQAGNTPQMLSHLSLIRAADALDQTDPNRSQGAS